MEVDLSIFGSPGRISVEDERDLLIPGRAEKQPVISYPGNFVPKSFRTVLVISYLLLFKIWSFRTQFGHFVPISYPVWSFRTCFYYFLENRFGHFVPFFTVSYPKSFRTHFSHFVPRSFPTHFQTRYELKNNNKNFCCCCCCCSPSPFQTISIGSPSIQKPAALLSTFNCCGLSANLYIH